MLRKSLDNLGELQRDVLEILWQLGQGSVHEVRDKLARKKKPAYTTVLSVLQKLEKAGWVEHSRDGKSYVYAPTRSRAEAGAGSARKLVKSVFGGDAVLLMQHLIRDGDLKDEELAELKEMIEHKRKERRLL